MGHIAVTAVDRQIMVLLREDGRVSYRTIARHVGLSSTAVHHRVKRLIDGGIIHVTAIVDPVQIGLVTGNLFLRVRPSALAGICEQLVTVDEADQVLVCTGRDSVRVSLVCRDYQHLLETVARVDALAGVESAELCLHLGIVESESGPWSALGAV